MSEGSKTTREHIPARSDVSQRHVTTDATRVHTPNRLQRALKGDGETRSMKGDATLLVHLLATVCGVLFFACGAGEQSLWWVGQASVEVDPLLHAVLSYP